MRKFPAMAAAVLSCQLLPALCHAAAAPPPPNGPTLIENFDNAKVPFWITSGTFKVDGGKLTLGNAENGRENCFIYAKPAINSKDIAYTVYTNFRVEVRARLVSDPALWGGFGIWFRTNGGGQFRNGDMNPEGGAGYAFLYLPGWKGIALVRRPHSMQFAGAPKVVPIDQNWHTYRVDAIGPHIVAYFDGAKVYDAIHPEKPFGYLSGAVGMGVLNRGVAEVDYFRITPLGGSATPPGPANPAVAHTP